MSRKRKKINEIGGAFGCRHMPHVMKVISTIRLHGGAVERVLKAKHIKINYRAENDKKLIHTTSASPSDVRAEKNAVAGVRRDCRANLGSDGKIGPLAVKPRPK